MVDCSGVDHKENGLIRSGIIFEHNQSSVDGSRRDVNGTVNVTSDVAYSIFQLGILAR